MTKNGIVLAKKFMRYCYHRTIALIRLNSKLTLSALVLDDLQVCYDKNTTALLLAPA